MFYLSTINRLDNPRLSDIEKEVLLDKLELFAARFVNGLVMQAHYQTGSLRPIGETTANRIAGDLFSFANALSDGRYSHFDMSDFHKNLRLDIPEHGAKNSVNLR